MKKLTVKNATGASAQVHTHGAHVVSWKNSAGEELLFVSKQAVFKPPKAIRGGIPICFPQFSDLGPLGQHGFARNSEWRVVSEEPSRVTLGLTPSEANLKEYPHPHEIQLTVAITDAGDLELITNVVNSGDSPMEFTYALHTYFATPDISKVSVEGLKGVQYLDSLQDRVQIEEQGDSVTFPENVDRIYLNTPADLKLVTSPTSTITLKKDGLPDAVVWNPWIEKAKAMGDMGDDEYKEFFCVEAAATKGTGCPIQLAPGKTWTSTQVLSVAHAAGHVVWDARN